MRLTGGRGKGRRLVPPPEGTRPTSSLAREALFQWLADRVQGAAVLDLFAGAGLLGLEALARGAGSAVFVERNRAALKVIRENLRRCGFSEQAKVVAAEVFAFLKRPERSPVPFDLILADPPYAAVPLERLLAAVISGDWLAEDGLLLFEASSRGEIVIPPGWSTVRDKVFGDTRLLLLAPSGEAPGAAG